MDESVGTRMKLIRAMVRKILIMPEGFEVFFKVGDLQFKVFLNDWQDNGVLGTSEATDSWQI